MSYVIVMDIIVGSNYISIHFVISSDYNRDNVVFHRDMLNFIQNMVTLSH